jgi:hypothetical protein
MVRGDGGPEPHFFMGRECQILFALIFLFWTPHKGNVYRALQGQDEARRCSVRV